MLNAFADVIVEVAVPDPIIAFSTRGAFRIPAGIYFGLVLFVLDELHVRKGPVRIIHLICINGVRIRDANHKFNLLCTLLLSSVPKERKFKPMSVITLADRLVKFKSIPHPLREEVDNHELDNICPLLFLLAIIEQKPIIVRLDDLVDAADIVERPALLLEEGTEHLLLVVELLAHLPELAVVLHDLPDHPAKFLVNQLGGFKLGILAELRINLLNLHHACLLVLLETPNGSSGCF